MPKGILSFFISLYHFSLSFRPPSLFLPPALATSNPLHSPLILYIPSDSSKCCSGDLPCTQSHKHLQNPHGGTCTLVNTANTHHSSFSFFLSFSNSLKHTHTHAHTHINTHNHKHTHLYTHSLDLLFFICSLFLFLTFIFSSLLFHTHTVFCSLFLTLYILHHFSELTHL